MRMSWRRRLSEQNGRRITRGSRRRLRSYASVCGRRRVQNTISRGVRAAEEQLKRIEAKPIPKPPKLTQVSSYFNIEPLQSQIVISADQLTKCWGEICILSDVSFTLAHDARILLLGPNGAGKTTLLKILLGLETSDSGEVRVVDGSRIGYLPQDPHL